MSFGSDSFDSRRLAEVRALAPGARQFAETEARPAREIDPRIVSVVPVRVAGDVKFATR